MLIQEKNEDIITDSHLGFNVISPISETNEFIKWSAIDTIVFSPNNHYSDCAQWIIYLNEPSKCDLKPNAWWLKKIVFSYKIKSIKKLE